MIIKSVFVWKDSKYYHTIWKHLAGGFMKWFIYFSFFLKIQPQKSWQFSEQPCVDNPMYVITCSCGWPFALLRTFPIFILDFSFCLCLYFWRCQWVLLFLFFFIIIIIYVRCKFVGLLISHKKNIIWWHFCFFLYISFCHCLVLFIILLNQQTAINRNLLWYCRN